MNKELTTTLDDRMRADAGQGISTAASDNMVPQISILQPLSPEVLDGPGQIPKAKAGDFLLGDVLISGKDGFYFQPANMTQIWLEFNPLDQGGGFVAAYPWNGENNPPPGTSSNGRFRYEFDNGNQCIHYRQLAGIVWRDKIGLEFVVPFKSTGHSIARQWMTDAMRANRLGGESRPLFGHLYRLQTTPVKNNKGQWFALKVGPPILLGTAEADQIVGNSEDAYVMGKALAGAFESQERVAETPVTQPPRRDDEIPY
jgi:hypothetical protein